MFAPTFVSEPTAATHTAIFCIDRLEPASGALLSVRWDTAISTIGANMKHKAIIAALAAMYLTTGGLTFGQGNSDHNRGYDDRGQHKGQQDSHEYKGRGRQDKHDNNGREPHDKHHGERGAGPSHNYYKGERLPAQYRHRQYVVDDWRSHRLSAPPRGYHWVQTGSDYVLVAIASGIILQLFLN
jgi:Ni/Co efflux regulator RcnB